MPILITVFHCIVSEPVILLLINYHVLTKNGSIDTNLLNHVHQCVDHEAIGVHQKTTTLTADIILKKSFSL